jgi:hypothetical protein
MVQEWKCAEHDGQEERIINDTIEKEAWMRERKKAGEAGPGFGTIGRGERSKTER